MSTTDELLEEMLEDAEEYATPVTDDDLQFWIDEHLRVISIPKNGVVAGVEGDKNVNKIKFGMNRYYHGFDMSTFSGRILYSNAKGNKNYYNITDMQASGSAITFSWLVDADAVQYMGKTAFVVYLFKTQGSELRQKFYSTLATLKVLEGMEVDSAVPVEKQTDIIERMKEEISAYAEEVKKSLPADYTAMTEQVSSLKEELANADKTIYTQKNNIESRNGYYISEKLELHKSEQWSSLFLPIIGTIKETHVKVKGTNLYFYKDLIPSIAFFDENKVLISAKYEAIMPNVPVEIPDNSAYVVMNSLSGTFSVEFFSILNQIKNLEKTHGNGNLLSKKCDGEEIKGYGLYTNEQPFYQHENSSVIRYALEKNKKYVFPSGNSSYKLVNGNPENYSMYFNSNGKNEFVNIFGAEFCYVDRIDHDVKKYGRELYEDTITNENSVFCSTEIKGTGDGLFYFHPFNIRKGDRIYTWRYSSINDGNIALFLSNEKRSSADIESKGIKFTDGYVEYVAEKDWGGFTTWANGGGSYKYLIAIERKKKQRHIKNCCMCCEFIRVG